MSFLTPFWLFLSLLILPILVLYMLKLRRREVQVSSTMIWEALLRDRQANTPWQRLRRNLLLLLQLLILALLVFAQARPYIPVPGLASEIVVAILDGSASMSAVDVPPNRFEASRAAIRSLIRSLPADTRMTLILATNPPRTLVSAEQDHQVLETALDSAVSTQGDADWQTTFALAAGAAAAASKNRADIIIYSDGGLPQKGLPPLPGEVRYVPMGSSSDNLAISAMAVRNSGSTSELFASVTNYGAETKSCVLSFYQENALLTAQRLELLPGVTASVSWQNLPPERSIYMARITAENEGDDSLDELAFDDTAFAVGQPVNAGRVLVASPGNFFLEQVLASLPGITAYRALAQASPDGSGEQQFHLPDESFDLYIFDGVLPTSGITGIPLLPDGNLLIINPPSNPLFQVTGTFTNTQLIYQSDDELMQYIDWKGVQIARARHVQLPPWGKRLVDSEGGPLLFAGETGGRRIAVLTFDLHESDLPLHVTFPILFANLIHYLAPPQSFDVPEGLQPGEALNILPQPGVDQVLVVTPSEKAFVLQPGTGSLVFSETGELGVYAINYLYENTESYDLVAVNLFDAGESNIKPVENIQVGLTNVSPTAEEKFGRFEIWRPVALLALLVLIIEWWVYHRQHSLPSPNLIKSVYGRIRNLRPG